MNEVEVAVASVLTACALVLCVLPTSNIFPRAHALPSHATTCVRRYVSSSTCSPHSGSRDRAVPRGKPTSIVHALCISCSPAACDIAIEFDAAVHEFRRFYRHTYLSLGIPPMTGCSVSSSVFFTLISSFPSY